MGVATDNGSKFMNEDVYDFLSQLLEDPVNFVFRTPKKKNDNARLEKKNFTHVGNILDNVRLADTCIEISCMIFIRIIDFSLKTFIHRR